MQKAIRVLIVDDSPLLRDIIADALASEPDIEVCGMASNGKQALQMLPTAAPDVITLDVQMPVMGGLATLDAIMSSQPIPVIMVSSLTQAGAATTLDALDRGAVDFVAKPEGFAAARGVFLEELPRKIRSAAAVDAHKIPRVTQQKPRRMKKPIPHTDSARLPASATDFADKCIAIGISTGGPPALTSLFEALRGPLPPIVVVQHMPGQFCSAFAARLDSLSQLSIKIAASGDELKPDHVYIAPGGQHLRIVRKGSHIVCDVRAGEPVSGHKPSVDVMMSSVADLYGSRVLGVIMTGMGRDGSDGCGRIRAQGGYVLGQNEATSDVYGMNKVAFAEGNVDRQFALEDAATVLVSQVQQLWGRSPVMA